MKYFFKKYYIQIITVFLFTGIIIFMISQSFRIIGMIKDKAQELRQIQLDYALAGEFLNHIYSFKKSVTYIDENGDQLSVLLPNDYDEKVHLFSFLEDLAYETGNKDILLTVKTGKNDSANSKKAIIPVTGDTMHIDIVLVGNYNNLIAFITKLENMQYFNDVLSFDIVKTTDSARTKDGGNQNVREDLIKTTMSVVFYLDKNNS